MPSRTGAYGSTSRRQASISHHPGKALSRNCILLRTRGPRRLATHRSSWSRAPGRKKYKHYKENGATSGFGTCFAPSTFGALGANHVLHPTYRSLNHISFIIARAGTARRPAAPVSLCRSLRLARAQNRARRGSSRFTTWPRNHLGCVATATRRRRSLRRYPRHVAMAIHKPRPPRPPPPLPPPLSLSLPLLHDNSDRLGTLAGRLIVFYLGVETLQQCERDHQAAGGLG